MKKITTIILTLSLTIAASAQQPLDTLKMDELRKSPVLSIDEAIAGRIPGVNVSFSDDAPGRFADYMFRGCQIQNPLYVIDGIRVSSSFVQSMNPAQVESIVVLTDIAAISRYGSEGCGGVIEITLKKGHQGKVKVDCDAFWGANLMSSSSLSGNDYVSDAFSTALLHNYSVSVSGGSSAAGSRFFANLGYLADGGVLNGTSNDRFQGSLRYEQKLSKKISFYLSAAYRSNRKNGIDTQIPYADYMMSEETPVEYANPDSYIMYYVMGNGTDPVPTLDNAFSKSIAAFVSGDVGLKWDITDCLNFNLTGFYSAGTSDNQKFNNKRTIFGAPDSPFGMNVNSSAMEERNNRYSLEALLTFAKTFAKGDALNITAGFLAGGRDVGYRGERTYNMTTEALGTAALNTGLFIPVSNFDAKYSQMQAYGRALYSIKGRYDVFASLSADTFAGKEKGKWNILPSAGAAWNFANEDFAKGGAISSGRLTASWGKVGTTLPSFSNEEVILASTVFNQIDASLSAGFWNDRLNVKLGYYNLGFEEWKTNGVELSFKAFPVKTDKVKWSVFANETLDFGEEKAKWGGAGTALEVAGFDVRTNMYWNPLYFRCANITAGYTIGRELLKNCSLRLFVNARSLCHKPIYDNFDFSVQPATSAPGRFGFTGGLSVNF